MCRYGLYGPYKKPYVCFKCRKVFKQTNSVELPESLGLSNGKVQECKCPQCGTLMADMGHDFKAPKQKDRQQWEKVRLLFQHGFAYHSCGCGGPGFRPSRLQDVYEFVDKNKTKSEGEILLEKIGRKVFGRK